MTVKAPQFSAGQLNVIRPAGGGRRHPGAAAHRPPGHAGSHHGALHDGHLALVRAAKRVPGAVVVVSIFVNLLQFGPTEDLDAYPRTLDADLELLRDEVSKWRSHPPRPPCTRTESAPPYTLARSGSAELEGATRPGHFAGMLTVVLKLLQIVRPDRAFFGERTYQQLVLIRQMVADLNVDVQIVGVPTVRSEADGWRCRRATAT